MEWEVPAEAADAVNKVESNSLLLLNYLPGVIAQPAERFLHTEEVSGPIPLNPTIHTKRDRSVAGLFVFGTQKNTAFRTVSLFLCLLVLERIEVSGNLVCLGILDYSVFFEDIALAVVEDEFHLHVLVVLVDDLDALFVAVCELDPVDLIVCI